MIIDVSKNDVVITGLYQYDYGLKIEFSGVNIEDGTELHFFQGECGCRTFIRNNIADFPDYLLASSKTVNAYVYLGNEEQGRTIKRLTFLIMPREQPPDYINPTKPSDYSRLLPIGGEIGDLVFKTEDGYAWKNIDEEFVTNEELQKVSERLPVAMTVQEILKICKV